MSCIVKIICENSVILGEGLIGEHGFAALVEIDDETILFDTGPGRGLISNAVALGIDLSRVRTVVLSHAHFDHSGGLLELLARTGPKRVLTGPGIFEAKYARRPDGREVFVGIPHRRELLESLGADFSAVEGPEELAPGAWATGPVPRRTDFESTEPMLFVRKEDGLAPDSVPEDQSLVVRTDRGGVVIAGCVHAGLINTLTYARNIADMDIHAVIGGTHLIFATDERITRTVETLKEMGVQMLSPAHCTGFRAMGTLHRSMGDKLIPCSVGSVFRF